jgi:hypothetical protein
MFAMLHGAWPLTPEQAEGDERACVESAVRAQVDAGLQLVTDGLVRWRDPAAALLDAINTRDTGANGLLVRAWRDTADVAAELAERAEDTMTPTTAAVLTGPYALASAAGLDAATTMTLALRLHDELVALAEAGCTLAVVEEPAATAIGADKDARRHFREAQSALLADEPPLHAMLAITGGSAWEAGPETILDAPYASYLFDLIEGPDNWYLVRATPGDLGIVCAALRAPSTGDQAPLLTWAARYAASANGRGPDRVGLANASSLGGLDVPAARASLETLTRAARLAALDPADAVAAGLDRRTFAQPTGRRARTRRLPRA